MWTWVVYLGNIFSNPNFLVKFHSPLKTLTSLTELAVTSCMTVDRDGQCVQMLFVQGSRRNDMKHSSKS